MNTKRTKCTSEQDVQNALVGGRPPRVDQQVAVGVQAPARGPEEAQHKVDDEADHCVQGYTAHPSGAPAVANATLQAAAAAYAQLKPFSSARQPKRGASGARRLMHAAAQRTQDDEAHAPRQDVVAGLARWHLPQHGHRDGLDVERERDRAHGRRKRDWQRTHHTPQPH